jgi:hypothetical protein
MPRLWEKDGGVEGMTPDAQQPLREPRECDYYYITSPGLKAKCTNPKKTRRYCEHATKAGICPGGIRTRPHTPTPENIKKAIDELEYSLSADPQEEIDCHIREAIALLKGVQ